MSLVLAALVLAFVPAPGSMPVAATPEIEIVPAPGSDWGTARADETLLRLLMQMGATPEGAASALAELDSLEVAGLTADDATLRRIAAGLDLGPAGTVPALDLVRAYARDWPVSLAGAEVPPRAVREIEALIARGIDPEEAAAQVLHSLREPGASGGEEAGEFAIGARPSVLADTTVCPSYDFGPFTPDGSWRTHSASFAAGGWKLYRFNVTAGHSYRFSFCTGGGTANFDAVIDQYSATCHWQSWTNSWCGIKGELFYEAPQTTAIYIRVKSYQGFSGPYTLAYRDTTPLGCANCPSQDFGPTTPSTSWQTHSSSITAGCWKLYRFETVAGRTYQFSTCQGGGGASFDTVLDQYSASCGLQASNDNSCGTGSEIAYLAPRTGPIWIRVRGNAGGAGSYTLAWRDSTTAGCAACPAADFGPLSPSAQWQTHTSTVTAGCWKLYSFQVQRGRTYRFGFCEGGGASSFDTVIDQLAANCAVQSTSDDACGTRSQLDYTAQASGTIFVKVRGKGTAAGAYRLAYRDVTPFPCAVCPNADYGPYTPATEWQTNTASILPGCWKLYRFEVTAGATYRFSLCDGGGVANFDTILDLYSGECRWQTWDDDACVPYSQLQYTATATGAIYIRVKGKDQAQGTFTLAWRKM